jgi:hypothetical protein
MGRLRTSNGIDLNLFRKSHQLEILNFFGPYVEEGLIDGKELVKGRIVLTAPSGYLYSNEILSRFFLILEQLFHT